MFSGNILKTLISVALIVTLFTTQTHTVFAARINCTDPATNISRGYGADWTRDECADTNGTRVWYHCAEDGYIAKVMEYGYAGCGQQPPSSTTTQPTNIGKIFGGIKPPPALDPFIKAGGNGAGGMSLFLSNLVSLIYIFAAITLLFMLLWGAFDWIISEGDKEKIKSAQNKIINAIIGIILFAVAFAILSVLGTFTGFRFFEPQSSPGCPLQNYSLQNGKCIYRYNTGSQCLPIFQEVSLSYCN